MKKRSAAEVAKEYNLDLKEISRRINLIHVHVDNIERHLSALKSDFEKIGTNIPGFSTDLLMLNIQARSIVRKVNKYCSPEETEMFGNDSDELYDLIEKWSKNGL